MPLPEKLPTSVGGVVTIMMLSLALMTDESA